jgi:hypothetical protein
MDLARELLEKNNNILVHFNATGDTYELIQDGIVKTKISRKEPKIWEFYTLRTQYNNKLRKNFEYIRSLYSNPNYDIFSKQTNYAHFIYNDGELLATIYSNDIHYNEFYRINEAYEKNKFNKFYAEIKEKYGDISIKSVVFDVDEDGPIYEYEIYSKDGEFIHSSYILNYDWLYWSRIVSEGKHNYT